MKKIKLSLIVLLIIGIIMFPAHALVLALFLMAVFIATGMIILAFKGGCKNHSSISDDEALAMYYLLKKKNKS